MTSKALQERFPILIEQHRGILYKICRSYCRSWDDREDLAQEIVVELWKSFAGFDERFRFSTWMYRIALNVAISSYRRELTRTQYVLASEERLLEAEDTARGQSDELTLLYGFIEQLGPLNKALVLLYLDGNSYQEIADVLGITETNVATKLSRLKKSMKQEFDETARR